MNKIGMAAVEERIWGEIARELERAEGIVRCLVFNDRFLRYLRVPGGVSFALEEFIPGGGQVGADLFLAWPGENNASDWPAPEAIFSSLREGGEARIFGFYAAPRPDDLRGWEGPVGGEMAFRLPPPGALSLGEIAGRLKTGPFNRYTLRKRGIYYDCRLQKDL